MKLKITVKESEKPQRKEIRWLDLPVGTVFEYKDGTTGLKIGSRVVVMRYSDGSALWLKEARGYRDDPIVQVLGLLTEIIIEK